MPNGWRSTFLQQFWHNEGPFLRLVRHFLTRLVRSEEDPMSSDVRLGAGALLGILAVPGALTSFILLDKYSTSLNWLRGRGHQDLLVISLPDKYLFLAMAMAITGIVTVLKWDKILPDTQDYLNLAPLPVRPRSVLAANAAAIALAVTVFAVDVNAVPSVLFPLFVSAAGETTLGAFLRFSLIHAAAMFLASIFTFCAVFAILGAISAVLPREALRAVSSWVRGALLIALLTLLVSGIAGPEPLLRTLQRDPHSPVRWLPPLWFLGLYQAWQQRATGVLAGLARLALPALGAALLLALLACALTYRRRFATTLESGRRPSQQPATALFVRLLDLFGGSDSFTRAAHRFAVRALLRNEAHRLCVAVAFGIGWLAAWRDGPLAAPFSAAFVLILGLRGAFEMPAAAPAAWIFRAILDPRAHETRPVARRVTVGFLTPLVLAPAFALAWWSATIGTAILHVLYLLALALILAELELSGFRKIPLTCPAPGFRDHLPMLVLAQFLGYEIFTRMGFGMEQWMLAAPPRFLLLPLAMAGAWYWSRVRLREAREAGEAEEGLTFENVQTPAVERLNL